MRWSLRRPAACRPPPFPPSAAPGPRVHLLYAAAFPRSRLNSNNISSLAAGLFDKLTKLTQLCVSPGGEGLCVALRTATTLTHCCLLLLVKVFAQ